MNGSHDADVTAAQHEAHNIFERLRRELEAASAEGDDAAVRRLTPRYERARREWHKLVDAQRRAQRAR